MLLSFSTPSNCLNCIYSSFKSCPTCELKNPSSQRPSCSCFSTVKLTTLSFKSLLCPVHASQEHQVTLLNPIEANHTYVPSSSMVGYISVYPMGKESLNNIFKLLAFNYTNNRCNQRRNTHSHHKF